MLLSANTELCQEGYKRHDKHCHIAAEADAVKDNPLDNINRDDQTNADEVRKIRTSSLRIYAKYAPLLCASRSATSFPLFSVCAIFNISSLFIPTTPPASFAKFYCHHYNTAKFTCQYYLQSFLVIFSCGSVLAVEQAQYDDMLIALS